MSRSRFLLPLAVFFLSSSLAAQQLPPAPGSSPLPLQPVQPKPRVLQPTRDPEAVTAVQAAISALGGDAAISQVQSFRALGQAKAPKELGGGDSTVTWEKSGEEFRMESTAGGKSNVVVSGRGKPAAISNDTGKDLPEHVTKALFVPALVASMLRDQLQDANSSISYVNSSKLTGKDVIVVRTATMQSGDSYAIGRTWYFDSTTRLPLRVEYGVPALQTTQVWYQAAVDLSDYRSLGGVQYPFKIVTYQQGRELQTVTLQAVEPNATVAPSRFDAPAGGVQ